MNATWFEIGNSVKAGRELFIIVNFQSMTTVKENWDMKYSFILLQVTFYAFCCCKNKEVK